MDNKATVILFLDCPVREAFIGSPPQVQQVSVPGEPYQGGYPDFMKYENIDDACSSCGPSRQSILEDICFYWAHHRDSVVVSDEPVITTLFLKKIVASNYMLCIGYIVALLGELDYNVSRRDRPISTLDITWIEERWKDLQAWNRQCSQYCDSVEAIMDSFHIPLSEAEASVSWEKCEKDFHVIYRKLRGMKTMSDNLISSFTGLAGILGNRQALREASRSLHEARSVKILTLLGMLFLPLTFASGILSMNGDFLPGSSLFWVYFAIAIPIILCVFGVVFLVSMGYGVDGGWSLKTWKESLSAIKGGKGA
jgi:hypothetical protein